MSPGSLRLRQYSYSESRKEAARLSTYASCTNCAMLTGFDEAPSSIMVLVEAPMNSDGPTKLRKHVLSQMPDPFPSTRRNRERKQGRNA